MSGYKTLSAYSDEESTPSYQNEPVVENSDDNQIKKKYGTAAIAYGAVIAVTMVLAFSSTTGRSSKVDSVDSTMSNVMQSSELKDALVASTDFNKLNTDVQNQLTGPMAASPPVPVLPTIPAPANVPVMEEAKAEVSVPSVSTSVPLAKQPKKALPKDENDGVVVLTAEQLAAAKATAAKDAVALPAEEGTTPPLPGTALYPPKKNSGLGQIDLHATGGSVTKGGKDKDAADPCHDGLSPRCTPPTSNPVEHRSLAGSPTKSPSSGLHKPTWRPSSKPNEHRRLSHADKEAANDAKHGSDKLSKKESKKIIEKKADQLEDKKSQLKKAALSTTKDKVFADRQLKSLKDKKEELKAFQAAALADSEDAPSLYSESEVDPAVSFSAKFATTTTTNKSERESKKSDAKNKAKVVAEESLKASKGETKQDAEKAMAVKATELKGTMKSLELKMEAKEEEIATKKATLKEAMSSAMLKLSASTSKDARKSSIKEAAAAEEKVIKAEKKELKSEKKELKSEKKELKSEKKELKNVKTLSSDQQKMTAWLAKAYASSSEGKNNANRRLHSLKV